MANVRNLLDDVADFVRLKNKPIKFQVSEKTTRLPHGGRKYVTELTAVRDAEPFGFNHAEYYGSKELMNELRNRRLPTGEIVGGIPEGIGVRYREFANADENFGPWPKDFLFDRFDNTIRKPVYSANSRGERSNEWRRMKNDGLIETQGKRYHITDKGRALLDSVATHAGAEAYQYYVPKDIQFLHEMGRRNLGVGEYEENQSNILELKQEE